MKKLKKKNPPPQFYEQIKNLIGTPVAIRIFNDTDLFNLTGILQKISDYDYRVQITDGKLKNPIIIATHTFQLNQIKLIQNNIIILKNSTGIYSRVGGRPDEEEVIDLLLKKVLISINIEQYKAFNYLICKLKYNIKEKLFYSFKENMYLVRFSFDSIYDLETTIEPFTMNEIRHLKVLI